MKFYAPQYGVTYKLISPYAVRGLTLTGNKDFFYFMLGVNNRSNKARAAQALRAGWEEYFTMVETPWGNRPRYGSPEWEELDRIRKTDRQRYTEEGKPTMHDVELPVGTLMTAQHIDGTYSTIRWHVKTPGSKRWVQLYTAFKNLDKFDVEEFPKEVTS